MKASEHGGRVPDSVGRWFCAPHDNVEIWTCGGFVTREEAVEEGRGIYGSETTFVIGEGVEVDVYGPDAESAIENISEAVYESCGDVAEDFLRNRTLGPAVNELDSKLDAVFAAWLTEHDLWPQFCKIDNIETIEPETA